MAEHDRFSAENLIAADQLDRLAESAHGWHRIQLAVLGFIGFCGLFWDGGSVDGLTGLQGLLMVLVALAFLLAIVAIFVVGRVAHAFQAPAETTGTDRETVERQARQLHTGIRMTYVAVALVVAATLSAWLPVSADDDAVVMADTTGRTWCGRLVEAPAGEARLITAEGPVAISLDRLALLRPVGDC
jgi:hypothetical protein